MIEIIPRIFSGHNALILEINYEREVKKFIIILRLNNILVKKDWVKEK